MAFASITPGGLDYVVAVEGLEALGADLEQVEDRIKKLAARAINATARKFRTESSRAIREQVNFPARFLDSRSDGKLRLVRNATATSMEAVIRGDFEARSLARFVSPSQRRPNFRSPSVEVRPGNRERMDRAFIIGLSNGNLGLAIRLRPGERVENKRKMVSFSKKDRNLYLLYGPSVDQVFRSVASDVAPGAAEYLEREFTRLTEALL